MKIVIAPDSFKGSLTSVEATQIIAKAFETTLPNCEIVKIPISDGGEGFVDAIYFSISGEIYETIVSGPLPNQKVKAKFLIKDKIAIIEMASASGLTLVPKAKRNPKITTTYGVGELIKKALDHNVNEIIIGVGGSATNDGGMGMASALGYKFLDKNGKQIKQGGINLLKLEKIDDSEVDERVKKVKFKVAVDVLNPLCGPEGASFIYAPQKGARKSDLPLLDKALKKLASIVKEKYKIDIENLPGAGAAGGLAGGLVAFCNAKIVRGIDIFLDLVSFNEKIKNANLIITGEGKIDSQVKYGKAIKGIIERAQNIPVIAIAGKIEGSSRELAYNLGLASIISMTHLGMKESYAIKNARGILFDASTQIANLIKNLCLNY
ncbi:glycerate kinase [Candidatus Kryptobacter tengchongensis]|uniref:glycerate kinase n=1 Tax=Kryptobacter tengchongensis TaxID=1643429 RepID=UPI0007072CD3|nr:glycerate kinase [Candidatus Kryptobacter tengchongensis]CUS78664.1 glycerate kinase [Candidatus Kryptobacter tengchongensis]CUU07631.1 glycerate kinase [Candidatus Kryptobacter tengchongensis]